MRARVRTWAVVGLTVLAGCDLGTDPSLTPIQDAEVALLAGAAVDAAGGDALSLERLLKRMQEAIQASGGNAKAQELIDASNALARQAREAAAGGDKAKAESLTQQSQAKLIEAVVLVLGPGVARDAVSAARAVLADLKAKLAGKSLPEKVAAQLATLERRLGEADAALTAGKPTDALRIALSVGAEVRALAGQDPNADAAKSVEEAAAWLNRAKTVVGASPSAEVAALLAKAAQLLTQAQEALKAGNRDVALSAATESAAISRKIYESTQPPTDPNKGSTEAARAIEEAAALLVKAKSAIGPNPSAEAVTSLNQAQQLLTQAQDALKAGKGDSALTLARQSSEISRKLIGSAPPPASDAAKVVEEASAWLARAKASVGATPSAEAAAKLAKAGQLLEQAQAALKAGKAADAVTLAKQSIEVSRTLVPTTTDKE